jgi:hypothetical protein
MLEFELRGARAFVDECKARLQERCGNKKGQVETNTSGDPTPRKQSRGWSSPSRQNLFNRLQWGFMKHDGQVLQGAASNYRILPRLFLVLYEKSALGGGFRPIGSVPEKTAE